MSITSLDDIVSFNQLVVGNEYDRADLHSFLKTRAHIAGFEITRQGKSFSCSRSSRNKDGPKRNKYIASIPEEKKRKSSSLKCGCQWSIKFSYKDRNCKTNSFIKLTNINLNHTNGCEPSFAQLNATLKRSGTLVRNISVSSMYRLTSVVEASMMRAALDRIRQCNNVPQNVRSMLLDFIVDGRILGKITSINAKKLCQIQSVPLAPPVFQIVERTSDDQRQHHQQKHPQYLTLTSAAGSTCQSRTDAVMVVMDNLRSDGIVKGWKDELLPVSSDFYASPTFLIERAAAPILGVQQYCVHVNGIVQQHGENNLMWMTRRSKSKSKFPGMLDHLVAGGQPAGISLTDNVIKKCQEKAGIPREMTFKCFQPAGAISYESYDTGRLGLDDDGIEISNKIGSGLISRSVLFCYDLILPKDFIPKPNDGEVEDFFIWTMEQAMESMKMEYHDPIKPNCYPVIIDYLLRTGYLSSETPGYLDVLRELRGGYCG